LAFATFLVWRLRTGACGVGACGFWRYRMPPNREKAFVGLNAFTNNVCESLSQYGEIQCLDISGRLILATIFFLNVIVHYKKKVMCVFIPEDHNEKCDVYVTCSLSLTERRPASRQCRDMKRSAHVHRHQRGDRL